MNLLKMVLLLFVIVSLTGCWSIKREVTVKPLEQIKLELPENPPVKLETIQWRVITENNYDQVFEKMKAKNQIPVLFGLTGGNYENLSINFAKLRAYIETQKKVIELYKLYYETPDMTLEE